MNEYYEPPEVLGPLSAESAMADERATFIRNTYLHLAGAIFAFTALEFVLFLSGAAAPIARLFLGSQYGWLLVLAGFMGASWVANMWAQSDQSVGTQYLGLGLYVLAEAIIFVPLLFIAEHVAPAAIPSAAVVTLTLFAGLTLFAFFSGVNFSFMRGALVIGSFVALGIIVASIAFGFQLGIFFSGAMCLFAGGAILYQTSAILRDYRTDQHVAASLALFAAVALLFWYVLRIFLAVSRR